MVADAWVVLVNTGKSSSDSDSEAEREDSDADKKVKKSKKSKKDKKDKKKKSKKSKKAVDEGGRKVAKVSRRIHYAKLQRNKNAKAYDAQDMAAILGVASSSYAPPADA